MKKFGGILLKSVISMILLVGLVYLGAVIYRAATKSRAGTAEADQKAWSNDWEGAAPLSRRAEILFLARTTPRKLCTHESVKYRYSWKYRACRIKSGA